MENKKDESFIDIKGYEGLYAVTKDGKVWSYPKSWIAGNKSQQEHKGKWLKFNLSKGYRTVAFLKNGRQRRFTVHRLVAQAYIPNPNNLPQINHKDNDHLNNCVENLEWCTAKENTQHAVSVGARENTIESRRGERSNWARFTEKQILEIRKLYQSGQTQDSIAEEFGTVQATVSDIIRKKVWKHI